MSFGQDEQHGMIYRILSNLGLSGVFGLIWLVYIAVICTFWGVVIYAAVHFLKKYW